MSSFAEEAGGAVEEADIDELSRLVVHHDAQVSLNYCKALESRGVSIQTIYLDLLTPVARRLGDLWVRDEHSFAEVTLGLCRLHSLLRDLGPIFLEDPELVSRVGADGTGDDASVAALRAENLLAMMA